MLTQQPTISMTPTFAANWHPGANERKSITVRRPVVQYLAIGVIALAVMSGMYFSSNWGGSTPSGKMAAAIPSAQDANTCSAEPLSVERVGTVLNVAPLLTGAGGDVTKWITPAIELANLTQLPAGSPVDPATAQTLNSVWESFVACSAIGDGSAYSLLSDDGLRRSIYQAIFNHSVDLRTYTESDRKSLEVDANVPVETSVETEANVLVPAVDGTPVSKPQVAEEPAIQTSKITSFGNLVLGDSVLLPDGRIVTSLVDSTRADQAEFAGLVVFVEIDGGWMIDDFDTFHG